MKPHNLHRLQQLLWRMNLYFLRDEPVSVRDLKNLIKDLVEVLQEENPPKSLPTP